MVLAPTLHPAMQSPQCVHASWCTPAAFGPEVKATLIGGREKQAASSMPSAARRSSASLASPSGGGTGSTGAGVGRSMARARSMPLVTESRSAWRAVGQASSCHTRSSGGSDTLALISEVPPRPQPTSTFISGLACSS